MLRLWLRVFAAVSMVAVSKFTLAQAPWPALNNPYCGVATFLNNAIPARGYSTMVQTGVGPTPVIFMQNAFPNPNLYRFALAHECGHHLSGHIVVALLGVFKPWMQQPQEAQADCWAAQALSSTGDMAGIQAALADAYYGGTAYRIQNIKQCAGIP